MFLFEYSDVERGLSWLQLFQAGFLLTMQVCELSGLFHVIYVAFRNHGRKGEFPKIKMITPSHPYQYNSKERGFWFV